MSITQKELASMRPPNYFGGNVRDMELLGEKNMTASMRPPNYFGGNHSHAVDVAAPSFALQ